MLFGGRAMGGGGGGGAGGNVFRTVSRAAVARTPPIQEPLSSSNANPSAAATTTTSATHKRSSTNSLSLSSPTSPFASCNLPSWPSSPHFDDFEWVTVEDDFERAQHGLLDDFVLGPVPSRDEVHNAVSALQQAFTPPSGQHPQFIRDKFGSEMDKDVIEQIASASSVGLELDWMEPSAYLCNSTYGSDRVYDAFHLLQTESSVQRMVVSLSSDKAVWDAVMNNDVVRELRESFYSAEDNGSQGTIDNAENDIKVTNIVKWIFQNTLGKVMEAIDNITKVLGDLFQLPTSGKAKAGDSNLFEERLRKSFMLSVVVLLIVVVTRTHKR